MNTKDLLSQISRLEYSLNDFSFEELDVEQASQLKKSFDLFKNQLEKRIFQPSNTSSKQEIDQTSKLTNDESIKNTDAPDVNLLVAHVSHEIRTPLNGIIGFTDLLKEDELTKVQLERVNAIQSASFSLMEIINELLEYSKLSSGLEKFESIDFNLNRLVSDVMYLCKTLLTNKNISLESHIDDSIPETLVGDPSKLSQVLLNLLGNAIKFVKDGSISFGVYLKKKKNDIYFLEFVIEDTGIGISKEDLEHIFDSFKQAENNNYAQETGTGLGLSIVKQIIENLGGDIRATSEIGVGTTFQFMLPFVKGNATKLLKSMENIAEESDAAAVKNIGVLVFEDNILNQKLIEQRLKSWGCTMHITDNAQYGLSILETHKIDVVLMDLKMPNMDGFKITELIRKSKLDFIRKVPVIAVSADFSANDKKNISQSGINDFILKPYVAEELLNKIITHTKSMKNTLAIPSKSVRPDSVVFADATKINLSVILEQCMGQTDVLEELIVLYKQNALEFIGILSTNLPDGDINLIASAAHKIKSGLAMMQSKSLHTIILQIEKNIKNDEDRKHLSFLFNCFVEEYPIVEDVIDEQIRALKQG